MPGATQSNAAATTVRRSKLDVKIFNVQQLSRQMFFVIFRKADKNKKCPASPVGQKGTSLSRGVPQTAAWEGSLAYGLSADYSGGTAAESHGLPRSLCLQIVTRV